MAEPSGRLSGVIAERYAIEREIGRGGMAFVYLARDLRHDTNVAVKVLNPETAARVGVERFSREVRITASLQHPNILSVFDSGEVDGQPFCVMPYVEGETLEDRIRRQGPLPVEEAIEFAAEIADGLAYAHAQGFVHRDVKPSNILLSHGHACLADFGIARAVDAAGHDRLTTSGLAVGTVSYMSPEQASGENVDGRSDLYSLGCVLYEMLTGAPPFTGASPRAVLARHLADAVPSVRTVRDTVPPALEAAIFKAMAKVPADRFADAAEFRKAIRLRDTAVQPALSPQRRFTGIWLGTAAVLVLALGALFGRRLLAPPIELDANRIMVFPLVVSEAPTLSPSMGEDVATVIGNTLDGTGPLRWIDGWTQLDPARRQNIRDLSESEARAVARAQRCAHYVTGRVIQQGRDSVRISLALYDVREGAEIARSSASAPLEEAWRGVRAVNDLLPELIPGGTREVIAEWENRPPLAIASFLLGEAAFRRIQLDEALNQYRNAVAADSTFAFAALRGAQAASWHHRADEAAAMIDIAMRQPLPPRYAAFARGYRAFLEGRADSAIAGFRASLAIDADMAVTWLQLGETWTHLLPQAGVPDDSALAAFQEAIRVDSTATNPLFHAIEILARRGDAGQLAPLVERFLAAGPQASYADQVRILYDCARLGPERMDWDSLASRLPFQTLVASFAVAGGGAQLPCAEAGYSALLRNDTAATAEAGNRRFFEIFGLQNILLAQGRDAEALARVDSFYARWGSGASLFLLGAPLYDSYRARAREIARNDALEYGADYALVEFPNRLWELGLLEAADANLDVAAGVAALLAERARRTGLDHDRRLAASVDAHVALARADSALARRRFAALVPPVAPGDSLKYDEALPAGAERLAWARLLAAGGEYRRAIDVANVFDSAWPVVFTLYLRPSLRLRADAAAALGDNRLATQFRARLDALERPAAER